MKLKAVFLDKDGTIIPDIPHNVDTSRIEMSEGVVEGLQLLQSHGYLLVIVSNQSGIAHGYFTVEQLDGVKEKINTLCSRIGIYLDGFYYCPHHPEASVSGYKVNCECRKPQPGMLLKAAGDMDIDLSRSWMVGDILHDVEAGNRAGCKTVLIHNGNEKQWEPGEHRMPEYFARDLSEAAKYILAANKAESTKHKTHSNSKYTLHKSG